jgi:predicted membrane protein
MLFIIAGVIFLLDNFGFASAVEIFHDYWPLIFVIWGISILLPKTYPVSQIEPQDTCTNEIRSDLFHQSNVFGDFSSKISSHNFKGGSISTVFGDSDIDLTAITIAEGDHTLRVHGIFGDSQLRIRKESAVKLTANSTFGKLLINGEREIELSPATPFISPTYASTSNRLHITISKVFGDIRVEIV